MIIIRENLFFHPIILHIHTSVSLPAPVKRIFQILLPKRHCSHSSILIAIAAATAIKSSALPGRRGPVYKQGSEDRPAQTRSSPGKNGGGGDSGVGSTSPTPRHHPSQPQREEREEEKARLKELKKEVDLADRLVVFGQEELPTNQKTTSATVDNRMVASGACLAASALSLPLHCRAGPIAIATTNNMAMSQALLDQLRQQLLMVVENEDHSAANEIIEQLENAALTKDVLEATRIGRYVNEVRKQTVERWPEFSKRCRSVIKQWQKIAEYRPSSSCEGSSNGGTPQLISPALRRGLTPRTPGKHSQVQQRVTSTDLPLPDTRSFTGQRSSVSPAVLANGVEQQRSGSYAPLPTKKISPQMAAIAQLAKQVHKSASLGAALCSLDEHVKTARSRPEDQYMNGAVINPPESLGALPPLGTAPTASLTYQPLTLKLKRSASGVQRLTAQSSTDSANGISPPTAQQSSVQAARKNVQSTAELVAQLSEQLPQHISRVFDIGATKEEKQDSITRKATPPTIASDLTIPAEEAPTTAPSIKPADEEDGKKARSDTKAEEITGILQQQSVVPMEVDGGPPKIKRKRGRPKKNAKPIQGLTSSEAVEEVSTFKHTTKFNWFANFPLVTDHKEEQPIQIPQEVYNEPDHSFVLPVRDRSLILLPYLDTGRPDWIVHDMPEQERFLFPDPVSWPAGAAKPPK